MTLYEPSEVERDDYLDLRLSVAQEALEGLGIILNDMPMMKGRGVDARPVVINVVYENKKGEVVTTFYTTAGIKRYQETIKWLLKQIPTTRR